MDLLLQLQADQLQVPVARPTVPETTALGAAYLAGLAEGVWGSLDDISSHWQLDREFQPEAEHAGADRRYEGWKRAVERSERLGDLSPRPGSRADNASSVTHYSRENAGGGSVEGLPAGVGDAGERRELATLPPPKRTPLAAQHELVTRGRQRRPRHIVRTGDAGGDRLRHLAALDERYEPRRLRRSADCMTQRHVRVVQDRAPIRIEVRERVRAEHSEERLGVGRLHESSRRLERVEASVARRISYEPNILDIDIFDLRDLVDEQIDEPGFGKSDDQLVDRSPSAPLEDLDADDVAADCTDATRHLAECTGTIGQPHSNRVVLHGRTLLRRA